MYSCAHLRAKSRRFQRRLRSETPACGRVCEAELRIARQSNPPFLRRCAPSKGLRPLRRCRALPRLPPEGGHPLARLSPFRGPDNRTPTP